MTELTITVPDWIGWVLIVGFGLTTILHIINARLHWLEIKLLKLNTRRKGR